mgnify:CR=1 FL=1
MVSKRLGQSDHEMNRMLNCQWVPTHDTTGGNGLSVAAATAQRDRKMKEYCPNITKCREITESRGQLDIQLYSDVSRRFNDVYTAENLTAARSDTVAEVPFTRCVACKALFTNASLFNMRPPALIDWIKSQFESASRGMLQPDVALKAARFEKKDTQRNRNKC